MMTTCISASNRHFSDQRWQQAYWLFSFSDYYDSGNVRLGKLRIFNDVVVQPHEGFGVHPHEEMEIVTIMLSGQMTHTDSAGARVVIHSGDVVRMTAGTGITHSERNLSGEPARFLQIWIFPDQQGLLPSYQQASFAPSGFAGKLVPLASGRGHAGAVGMHADAAIYRACFQSGFKVDYAVGADRSALVYVLSGLMTVNGFAVEQGGHARVQKEEGITLASPSDSEFILVDVAAR
jgi:redox-sensitive bicupin YhaK (pirin superfamily)